MSQLIGKNINETLQVKDFKYIGHKNVHNVYGQITIYGDNKMIFEKHKWVGNSLTKIRKFVGDEVWKSFLQISLAEYNEREILDMQTIH